MEGTSRHAATYSIFAKILIREVKLLVYDKDADERVDSPAWAVSMYDDQESEPSISRRESTHDKHLCRTILAR